MVKPCRLYLITPPAIADLAAFSRELETTMAAGDVAALQIRLKPAEVGEIATLVTALGPIVRAQGASLILNDRPDLAARLDCDGVHIGQRDGTVAAARAAVGLDRTVGVTCHDSRDLAMMAADQGADYVAFGAFFPTTTKETVHRPDPEILSIWQETTVTPCVAIGGITVENCRPLVTAGADFLAVCSGVWSHPDGAAASVTAFNAEIDQGLIARSA